MLELHCYSLHKVQVTVKTRVIRLRVTEGPNMCNQIAFCAVQTHAGYIGYIHAMHG